MSSHRPASFSADLVWSYVASGARVLSWIVVSAAVYRRAGAEALALLTLVRTTLALLNYASAGLLPAIIHFSATRTLSPAPTGESPTDNIRLIQRTGVALSWLFAGIGLLILVGWALLLARTMEVALLAGLFGAGVLVRIGSDAWGAILQSRGQIAWDSQLQAMLEFLWALLAVGTLWVHPDAWAAVVGGAYLKSAIIVAMLRCYCAGGIKPPPCPPPENRGRVLRRALNGGVVRRLLTFGGIVVLGQLADFLYAPTDCLLIRYLIDLRSVADYSPAIQIDAGLLLLSGGLAAVLLPRSAQAFARDDHATLWRYYWRGTLAVSAILLISAGVIWLFSARILKLWLGEAMPATEAILPLVLIHTVVGGSAGIGRSILLAAGRARAYTTAALLAGVANVVISFTLVRYADLGLKGIVLGTIIVVVARCGVWLPWYVWRVTR